MKVCECGKPIYRHGSCKECYDKVQEMWKKVLSPPLKPIPSGRPISESIKIKS